MSRIRSGRTRHLILSATAALAAVAFVSGCGGGSNSASSTSTGGGAFVAGAEAACTRADGRIAALGTPRQAQVLAYLERTEEVVEDLHEEVAALAGPDPAGQAYTEALGRSVIVLNQMANAARNENFDAVHEISDELVALHLGELAEEAGLRSCAVVPGAGS